MKTVKIITIYLLSLLAFLPDYSFLYRNETPANIFTWIDPAYLAWFLIVGLLGCVCICRQPLKEFSRNIFTRESWIVLLVNVVFVIFIMLVGKAIGQYEINWTGVLNRCIHCYVFVAFMEEWIYRGFIVTQMKKVMKNERAIVIMSAVLFAVSHLPAYFMHTSELTLGGILYRLLIPLLLGLVFAHIYLCNGNLFTVIILHGTYNLIESIAFDSWYYVAYGIAWLLMIGYVVLERKRSL